MPYRLALFSIAAFSSAWWPALPGIALIVGASLISAGISIYTRRRSTLLLLSVLAGIAWAGVWGHARLHSALPSELDKTDYWVTGVISGLPRPGAISQRFVLAVETLQSPDGQPVNLPALRYVQLNWYGAPELQPGQRWQLLVRLRAPRGFTNPGGFDYRARLLRSGIDALGYVRQVESAVLLGNSRRFFIDSWRYRIRNSIHQLPTSEIGRALLVALTVGDQAALSSAVWQRTRVTGTVHLLIVSGLHIGMVAFGAGILGSLLGRVSSAAGLPVTRVQAGALIGWVAAGFYTALAGFSLPAQRALVMVSVVLLALLWRRAVQPWLALLWALAIQALIDPLAVLSPGFWLSYGAVASLIAYFGSRPVMGWFRSLLRAQILVVLMLAGGLLYFQGNVPLIAPAVNLLAIPWLSITVVPLALLGVLMHPLSGAVAATFWELAAWQLSMFDRLLRSAAELATVATWRVTTDQHLLLAVATIFTAILLLMPRGLGLRWLAVVPMLALSLLEPPQSPDLRVTTLDVGQGLAVIIETNGGVVLYDTGPRFSDRFDAGSAIIAPFLRYRGVAAIDTLVVSHSDSDHSGGLSGLAGHVSIGRLLAGQIGQLSAAAQGTMTYEACRSGQSWRLGDVMFTVLHPDGENDYSDNNSSCVLLLQWRDQTVLLAGDINAAAESRLLTQQQLPAGVTLLVAPHHGSKSSSTPGFVAALAPQHVVYSTGFNHHFGHPHAEVVARYRSVAASQWNTADSGALTFQWDNLQELQVFEARRSVRRYWFD